MTYYCTPRRGYQGALLGIAPYPFTDLPDADLTLAEPILLGPFRAATYAYDSTTTADARRGDLQIEAPWQRTFTHTSCSKFAAPSWASNRGVRVPDSSLRSAQRWHGQWRLPNIQLGAFRPRAHLVLARGVESCQVKLLQGLGDVCFYSKRSPCCSLPLLPFDNVMKTRSNGLAQVKWAVASLAAGPLRPLPCCSFEPALETPKGHRRR